MAKFADQAGLARFWHNVKRYVDAVAAAVTGQLGSLADSVAALRGWAAATPYKSVDGDSPTLASDIWEHAVEREDYGPENVVFVRGASLSVTDTNGVMMVTNIVIPINWGSETGVLILLDSASSVLVCHPAAGDETFTPMDGFYGAAIGNSTYYGGYMDPYAASMGYVNEKTSQLRADGVVLSSPDGGRWVVGVDNEGNLNTVAEQGGTR